MIILSSDNSANEATGSITNDMIIAYTGYSDFLFNIPQIGKVITNDNLL